MAQNIFFTNYLRTRHDEKPRSDKRSPRSKRAGVVGTFCSWDCAKKWNEANSLDELNKKKTSKINEISLKTIKICSISMIFSKFR